MIVPRGLDGIALPALATLALLGVLGVSIARADRPTQVFLTRRRPRRNSVRMVALSREVLRHSALNWRGRYFLMSTSTLLCSGARPRSRF